MLKDQNIKELLNKMDNIKFDIKQDNEIHKISPTKKTTTKRAVNKTKESPSTIKEKPILQFHYHKDLPQPSDERLNQLREQVLKLYEINKSQPEQRSEDWYKMRNEKITASDWAAALGKNPYSYRKGLLRAKCGETKKFYGGHMQHGVKYEPVANMIYEYRNNVEIIEFGLLPHPEIDFLGASPDGITKDGIMVEIKCPPKREITGEPPLYYWIQVQGQLEICELDRCDFLECKIEEYVLDEDYFNDHYNGNYFYNGLGLEKGCTLTFMDKTTTDYIYVHSKLGIDRVEYLEWLDEKKEEILQDKNMIYIDTTYWKLMAISCVPIYRDQDWFKGNLPELCKFWDDVLYYREVGTAEIQPKPRKKKEVSQTIHIDTEITDYTDDGKKLIEFHDTSRFNKQCFFSNVGEPLSSDTGTGTKTDINTDSNTDDRIKKIIETKERWIKLKIKDNVSLFSNKK